MNEIKRHRVKFYSKEDMSAGHQLLNAEEILNNYNNEIDFSLIELLEFYNIKLYFDNQLFLTNWNDDRKNKFIKTVEQASKKLNEKILSINDQTIEKELIDLDYNYFDDFWSLINNLSIFKNISEKTLDNLLQNTQRQIYYILKQKKIVEKFDKIIREFLIEYENSAEILLSSLEEKDAFRKKDVIYFPKSLSLADKENIIIAYLETDEPNLNYVRLIENSKDTSELKLSPKTRLKAKKKSDELNDKFLQNSNSWKVGISVFFSKDQTEPVIINSENTDLIVSYSESFIDQFTNNFDLFLVFKYLFFYTDNKNLITLVSKQSELDVLERTFMKSKNEYETGFAFQRKENLSNIQLFIYDHYLQRKDKNIETLINSYIDFINEKINPNKLLFKISSAQTSYLEKIRIIAPDFEFLLKQYKTLYITHN
jgi:hypothetical protein